MIEVSKEKRMSWGPEMKIRLEIDEGKEEEEIVIRCRELNEEVLQIQRAIQDVTGKRQRFVFYKGEKEYYLPLEDILFFETDEAGISAHTGNDIFQVKYKLYELEELLPKCFIRVSKSTILNANHIYSIDRNITSFSTVSFEKTHKQVYVSRRYYKTLKNYLEEKR